MIPTQKTFNVFSLKLINAIKILMIAPISYAMKVITSPKPNIVLRNTVKTTNMKSNVLSPQLTNATVMLLTAPGSCAKKEIT